MLLKMKRESWWLINPLGFSTRDTFGAQNWYFCGILAETEFEKYRRKG